MFSPFFINSNLWKSDPSNVSNEIFLNEIGGNTGNSYITYALLKKLYGHEFPLMKHIPCIYTHDFSKTDEDADYINNCSSHVFLILQDQIRLSESYGLKLPIKHLTQLISKLKKPLVIAGIGANSFQGFDPEFAKKLPAELVRFLRFIADRTNLIGVRGEYTAQVLNDLGIKNISEIGCPSFFESGRNRVIEKRGYHKTIFTSPCKAAYCNKGRIILQDELALMNAARYNQAEQLAPYEIKKFLKKEYIYFSNMDEWKKCLARHDFACGGHLHGAIASLNAGVPSAVMNTDSRVKEMCALLKIPHLPQMLSCKSIRKIYDICDYSEMNKAYPILYKNYESFLRSNDIPFNKMDSKEIPNIPLYPVLSEKYKKLLRKKIRAARIEKYMPFWISRRKGRIFIRFFWLNVARFKIKNT